MRIVRSGGELVEELYARDAKGKFRLLLLSPTHPNLLTARGQRMNLLQGVSEGLFAEPPTFAFDGYSVKRSPDGATLTLSASAEGRRVTKDVFVPAKGGKLKVTLRAHIEGPYPVARYFLATYAFAPDGKRMSSYGRPDATYAPAIRPQRDQVIADHYFRAPAILAQKGTLGATLLPDLDVLANNRPIPAMADLDAANGVVDAPLLSYGLGDARLVGHVYFAHDPSMARPVPSDLEVAMDVLLDAKAEPYAAHRKASEFVWERYGTHYFDRVLPQAMPFEEYARACYPAAFKEAWYEHELDGHPVGGLTSGWGKEMGWTSWQCWFNQLRSAWGLRWWGKRLGEKDWVGRADKMLNLALAAPMDRGAVPTTYMSREKQWKGSLIAPSPECYYDLPSIAWKGLWLLKWLEFPDCPRRPEVERQVREMAEFMVRSQNADGSFPTWLTKDHKAVPILDHSAGSGLPAWFLAEASVARASSPRTPAGGSSTSRAGSPSHTQAVQRAADFLVREIVDGAYYYDFETFFSCSPKPYRHRGGEPNHEAMRDPHTLQAPQNTLCMQWTAEALRVASKVMGRKGYTDHANKALEMMNLYQNVWPISYRKVAYTYGGFGVQNSDGEYNDARQAQFGASLCDFGAELGRKDYFERGVAAVRASMTLINHPRHIELGIYPNPNYPFGLQPENNGHGGRDEQNGRTGFDWGEGSGLASMAYLLEKYGGAFMHESGKWAVGIDGVAFAGGAPSNALPGPSPARNLEIVSSGGRRETGLLPAAPDLGSGPMIADPHFDFTDWRMHGWTIQGNFIYWPTRSARMNFAAAGQPFFGTAENGRGGYDDSYTGTILSPRFGVMKSKIRLLVGGGEGEGVFVELLDSQGKRIYVERGRNDERMDERVWDVSKYRGQALQIRIVDRETQGWGHINVGQIRITD